MKKVLLTIACVAFAFAANAQWVVSGNLGFTSNGGHQEINNVLGTVSNNYVVPGYLTTKSHSLEIVPSIGYKFNDNMQAGLKFGIVYNKNTNFNALAYAADKEDYTSVSGTSFEIAPYFRYYFAQAGKFNFFAEATVDLGFMPHSKTHFFDNFGPVAIDTVVESNTKYMAFGISIVPGVNYQLNDHFSIDCYIDLLSLNYQMTKATTFVDLTTPAATASNETIDVRNDFYFGAMGLPQTVNSHLALFRLGLNYAF